jgi:hypothetical protein
MALKASAGPTCSIEFWDLFLVERKFREMKSCCGVLGAMPVAWLVLIGSRADLCLLRLVANQSKWLDLISCCDCLVQQWM